MRRITWASLAFLLAAVAVAACSAAPATGPTGDASPSSPAATVPTATANGSTSASLGRAAGPFGLLRLPADAQVAFSRNAVIWCVPARGAATGPVPTTTYWRVDVKTGRRTRDDWLTALLGARRVDTWMIAGSSVAWLDTTQRMTRSGGTVVVAARLETARRPSTAARSLAGPSWGGLDSGGRYDGSTALSAFEGRVCWLQDEGRRIDASGVLSPGRAADQWLVDLTGRRARLPVGAYVLALSGDEAFWGGGLWRATDFGTRIVHWGEPVAGGLWLHTVRLPVRASTPAVAERNILAFTAVPPDATDLAEGQVWVCDRDSHTARRLTSGGQRVAAMSAGIVVYIDHRPWTASRPQEELWGVDLAGSGRPFRIASPGAEIDEANVTMVGNELFWTLPGTGSTLVYGVRLVRRGGTVEVEPL